MTSVVVFQSGAKLRDMEPEQITELDSWPKEPTEFEDGSRMEFIDAKHPMDPHLAVVRGFEPGTQEPSWDISLLSRDPSITVKLGGNLYEVKHLNHAEQEQFDARRGIER